MYLTIIIVKRLAQVIADMVERKPDTRKDGLRTFTSFKRRVGGQLVHNK